MSDQVIRTIVLSGNETHVETLSGKVFVCISATAGFTIRNADGPALPIVQGRGFGAPDSPSFNRLTFVDTSGSTNTITFYVGDEPFRVVEPSEVALSSATLTGITPAAVTHSADLTDVDNTSTAFAAKKSIQVWNDGAVDITVNFGSGARILAPGENTGQLKVTRPQDVLPTVTVVTTGGGGGSAKVVWMA